MCDQTKLTIPSYMYTKNNVYRAKLTRRCSENVYIRQRVEDWTECAQTHTQTE